jgi:hypothetical protein
VSLTIQERLKIGMMTEPVVPTTLVAEVGEFLEPGSLKLALAT